MQEELKPNFPQAIPLSTHVMEFTEDQDPKIAIAAIENGKYVLIKDFFSTGLTVLHALSYKLKQSQTDKSFLGQRKYRSVFRNYSNKILLRIKDHQIVAKKSPSIGWIEKFYSEASSFYLPFPQVQGLNSAWQWHIKGVSVPVLRNKIHPYYGTYFPSRFEHLILLDNWLSRYEGPKKSAYDIGVGSGIISLQLIQHKFQKSFATDINVNAIIGLKESMGETKLSRKIELEHASLFGKRTTKSELIIFNPPWLPATQELDNLDEAVYYNDGLFKAFFERAAERLTPDGRVVLLFSNLAQITKLAETNPIEEELKNNDRFELDLHLAKKVGLASKDTKRDQTWRAEEKVQLWVLKLKEIAE